MTESRPLPELPQALPRPTTDAHTHLGTTMRKTGLSASELIERAKEVNVTRLVDVGYDAESSRTAVEMAEAYPEVVAAIAIHPHDAVSLGAGLPAALDAVGNLIGTSPRLSAIGETGLDYHWVKDAAGRALQKEVFATHIAWAKDADLALVIHDRDAHDDIADVLDAEGWPERVQMHCFSGDSDFARRCLDAGAHISFPGTVTFKANEALREAARITPVDRILVETDAPYLTPMPHRGRPNASWLIPHTVRFLAEVRGEDVAVLCEALADNATALFGEW